MTFSKLLIAGAIALAIQPVFADPHINLQMMQGPNGEAVVSSTNFMNMSKNGRFLMFRNNFHHYSSPLPRPNERLWVQDIKSGVTTAVSDASHLVIDGGAYGISENGQYVAYFGHVNTTSVFTLWVKNRVSGSLTAVTSSVSPDQRVYVSNTGDVVYKSSAGVEKYTLSTGIATVLLADTTLLVNSVDANVKKVVYLTRAFGPNGAPYYTAFLYDEATQTSTKVSGAYSYDVRAAAISANGQYVAVTYNAPDALSVSAQVRNLATGVVNSVTENDIYVEEPNGAVSNYRPLDVSNDGVYISFRGFLTAGHPDYDVAASAGRGVLDRMFRVNMITQESVSVSQTYDGSANDNFINIGAYLSNDGRFVGFAANAKNLLPVTPVSAEEPYHATVETFASNYVFVGMPNSDQNWTHYSSMSLVADHTWEGKLSFDGVGVDAFKFDVGGAFSGFDYVPTANWAENYGVNGTLSGANIVVAQGAGEYKITFNDSSKQYTVTKIIAPTTMVNVSFSCQNGTTYNGQNVYAVGNIAALGNWNTAQAVLLAPTSYPTWTGTISLPANTTVEWKCVKREAANPANGVQWESGSNTVINTGTSQTTSGAF